MTDIDMTEFEQTYARHLAKVAEAKKLNKTVLFDTLASLGVTTIVVDFDGEGDSGQINSVAAFVNDQPFQLPKTMLTIRSASWSDDGLQTRDIPLEEGVEEICYGYLTQEHGGWENNEGAYGEFTLTVAERKVELDFNMRFSDSANYSHTF
jgi:hypothetical protein